MRYTYEQNICLLKKAVQNMYIDFHLYLYLFKWAHCLKYSALLLPMNMIVTFIISYIYIMIIYTTLQICHSNPQNIKLFDHRTPDQPFALNSSWVALVCWADPSSIKCQSSTMAPGQSNWWNINDTAILQHQGIDLEVSGIPFITILSKLFVLMLKAQQ